MKDHISIIDFKHISFKRTAFRFYNPMLITDKINETLYMYLLYWFRFYWSLFYGVVTLISCTIYFIVNFQY